ncbi:hypothetical protein OA184_02790 [SAR86 cluster bacterium]|nr:hypothetical protein [SAR86 cluster bacterium]
MIKKNFVIAMLIFLTPILVILSSTIWYYSGASLPEGRVNNGQLLSPPIDVGKLGVTYDYQPFNIETIERDWMIFQFIKGDCSLICDDAAYVARQANIALNRESIRVSRFLLSDSDKNFDILEKYKPLNHGTYGESSLITKEFESQNINPFEEGSLFIVDPLGNIIMFYGPKEDKNENFKQILEDLKKLLRVSKIG